MLYAGFDLLISTNLSTIVFIMMCKNSHSLPIPLTFKRLQYYIVDADSVQTFESRLDRLSLDQPIISDWKGDLTGNGNCSFKCYSIVD